MTDRDNTGRLNATILDPQRWGWTAASGVADLLTPHERARRPPAKRSFFRSKRKRDSKEAFGSAASEATGEDGEGDESAKRHALEVIQSTESMEESQQSEQRVSEQGKPLAPSSTLAGGESPQDETLAAPTASVASVSQSDESSAAVFSALRYPITGEETADCLDWYTYHRGRTGQEQRDEQTGELLYDLPNPTDTNHHISEPSWSNAKISIRFPLDDRNRRADGRMDGRRCVFRETVVWDWLGSNSVVVDAEVHDGTSPAQSGILEKTPMEIAATIAQEYGLTFPETIDLAEYIQGQLRTWVQQEALQASPVTCIDPTTGQRREKPSASLTELYGNVIGMTEGGFEDKPGAGVVQRSFPIPRKQSSVESSKKPSKTKPQAQKKEVKRTVKADQECIEEVRRRLLRASTEDIKAKASGGGPVGELKVERGLSCHICPHVDGSFGQFACGQPGHSFCREHTKLKFGLPLDADRISLAHCPICSLHCSCDSCTATLEKLAADFKARGIEQGCLVHDTKFDDLLLLARTNRVSVSKKPNARNKSKSATFLTEKVCVPKIPESDLPREVSEGIDIDPGTDADYAATYSENGPTFPPGISFSIKPAGANLSTKTSFTIEDGSVDFCNNCKNHGNLLCCDFCPRAFHAKCIKTTDVDEQSDSPWECPSCCAEKEGLKEDNVDGSKSLEKIASVYSTAAVGDDDMQRLLATVHQMLLRLIDYDFGYVFSSPVDIEQFPDYLKTVQNPMDLGTISEKILAGSYRESKEESLEEVAIKVLKDVDLVWKNCYQYNVEGSSVYRMALVQERRANAIREASFSHLLTENISRALGSEKASAVLLPQKPVVAIGTQGTVRPQKSRHKITVSRRNHNGRPIAVLDPETRKIVKIYSTMQSAGAAVVFLLGLGHKCEWHNIEIDTVPKVRRVIKDTDEKPSYTLFGYRWLFLDSLRAGRVAFPKHDPTLTNHAELRTCQQERSRSIIRKRNREGKLCAEFQSVDDAYADYVSSSRGSPQNGSIGKKRFQSEYLDGKTDLKGSFYSAESVTEEPVTVKTGEVDPGSADAEKSVDASVEETTDKGLANGTNGSRIGDDHALLHEKRTQNEDEGVDNGAENVGEPDSANQDKLCSADHPALKAAAVDGSVLTNGSNA